MTATKKKGGKSALPGARRGTDTFYLDPDELVIVGLDPGYTSRTHVLWVPSATAPVDADLKRRIKRAGKNRTAVKVKREGDVVLVAQGRGRVKAMRELKAEALAAGEEPIMVRCEVERGADLDLLEGIADENCGRKVEDPVTRAHLALQLLEAGREKDYVCEQVGVPSHAMLGNMLKLLDLVQELQDAVAAGRVAWTTAVKVHGRPSSVQRALARGEKPEAKDRGPKPPKRAAPRKLVSVLQSAEAWAQGRTSNEVTILKWALGYLADEDLAKALPHLAADLGPKPRAKKAKAE